MRTRTKVALARIASRALVWMRRGVGAGGFATVSRRGVRWHLDLTEGIELSIYLLGGFEISVSKAGGRWVRPGAVILDLGANIGAHTLPLARYVGCRGKVVAVEATAYAFRRLQRNLALNPDLAKRVVPVHALLVADRQQRATATAFASWPLASNGGVRSSHGGVAKPTQGARVTTLDALVQNLALGPVEFVKIDTDGSEFGILSGGRETLRRWRPTLLLEMAPYAFEHSEQTFEQMIDLLCSLDYRFFQLDGVTELPRSAGELAARIPDGAAINALAFANANRAGEPPIADAPKRS